METVELNCLTMLIHLRQMRYNWLGQAEVWYWEYQLGKEKLCAEICKKK